MFRTPAAMQELAFDVQLAVVPVLNRPSANILEPVHGKMLELLLTMNASDSVRPKAEMVACAAAELLGQDGPIQSFPVVGGGGGGGGGGGVTDGGVTVYPSAVSCAAAASAS